MAQSLFIDDLATLLVAWNFSTTDARLFAYLLLKNEPATLDDIAQDLAISKTSACVAAKSLEVHGNARRVRERGTKRVSYVIGEDPGAPLHKQLRLLGMMADLIAERAGSVAHGSAAGRLKRLAKFHRDLRAAMAQVIMPADGPDREI